MIDATSSPNQDLFECNELRQFTSIDQFAEKGAADEPEVLSDRHRSAILSKLNGHSFMN